MPYGACNPALRPDLATPAGCTPPRADSNPAFVCDLGNRSAVEKLLDIKRARGSQKMSVLCRSLQARALVGRPCWRARRSFPCPALGHAWRAALLVGFCCCFAEPTATCYAGTLLTTFCTPTPHPPWPQDVDTYTLGWPPPRAPGQPAMFKLVKRVLPGPVSVACHKHRCRARLFCWFDCEVLLQRCSTRLRQAAAARCCRSGWVSRSDQGKVAQGGWLRPVQRCGHSQACGPRALLFMLSLFLHGYPRPSASVHFQVRFGSSLTHRPAPCPAQPWLPPLQAQRTAVHLHPSRLQGAS